MMRKKLWNPIKVAIRSNRKFATSEIPVSLLLRVVVYLLLLLRSTPYYFFYSSSQILALSLIAIESRLTVIVSPRIIFDDSHVQ
jgi:hypothetical protein